MCGGRRKDKLGNILTIQWRGVAQAEVIRICPDGCAGHVVEGRVSRQVNLGQLEGYCCAWGKLD